jgi:hypothetical protein
VIWPRFREVMVHSATIRWKRLDFRLSHYTLDDLRELFEEILWYLFIRITPTGPLSRSSKKSYSPISAV